MESYDGEGDYYGKKCNLFVQSSHRGSERITKGNEMYAMEESRRSHRKSWEMRASIRI